MLEGKRLIIEIAIANFGPSVCVCVCVTSSLKNGRTDWLILILLSSPWSRDGFGVKNPDPVPGSPEKRKTIWYYSFFAGFCKIILKIFENHKST